LVRKPRSSKLNKSSSQLRKQHQSQLLLDKALLSKQAEISPIREKETKRKQLEGMEKARTNNSKNKEQTEARRVRVSKVQLRLPLC